MSASPSSLSPRTCDVAVIGSGIVGLSTAHHLLDRGLSCTLIDPKGPAGESLSATPMPIHLVLFFWFALSFTPVPAGNTK